MHYFNSANELYCIGLGYSHMDDSVKALEYYQRSLEIYTKKYGERHYCTEFVREKMEQVYKPLMDLPLSF